MDKINFQNLPNTTTPVNATNLNLLQTNTENAINSVSDYSSTETVIGKWIDDKPIYRKVIQFTSNISAATTTTVAHNISNLGSVIKLELLLQSTSGLIYTAPLVGYNGNITDKMYCWLDGTNINIYSTGGWDYVWTKTVIIQYTKTTD